MSSSTTSTHGCCGHDHGATPGCCNPTHSSSCCNHTHSSSCYTPTTPIESQPHVYSETRNQPHSEPINPHPSHCCCCHHNEEEIEWEGDEDVDENFKQFVKSMSYNMENAEGNNGLSFPKATIDPKMVQLQKDTVDFVTSVILMHENDFYRLVTEHYNGNYELILGHTKAHIINMISMATNTYYNSVYKLVQESYENPYERGAEIVELILTMKNFGGYGAHVLLDKLIRLTFETHIDVVREKLVFTDKDAFEQSVLSEVNTKLLSLNLLHIMAKGENDNDNFVILPEGVSAFDIKIDKNVQE